MTWSLCPSDSWLTGEHHKTAVTYAFINECVTGVCVCVSSVWDVYLGLGSYREMLEKPRPHDVGGHLGEDAALFLPPLVFFRIIVVPCAR